MHLKLPSRSLDAFVGLCAEPIFETLELLLLPDGHTLLLAEKQAI